MQVDDRHLLADRYMGVHTRDGRWERGAQHLSLPQARTRVPLVRPPPVRLISLGHLEPSSSACPRGAPTSRSRSEAPPPPVPPPPVPSPAWRRRGAHRCSRPLLPKAALSAEWPVLRRGGAGRAWATRRLGLSPLTSRAFSRSGSGPARSELGPRRVSVFAAPRAPVRGQARGRRPAGVVRGAGRLERVAVHVHRRRVA